MADGCYTAELTDLAEAAGKHVLVVGYGKSCDVAYSVSVIATGTTAAPASPCGRCRDASPA